MTIRLEKRESILQILSSEILKDAEKCYKDNNKISNEILQSCFSIFGPVFKTASELLDRCKIIEYTSRDRIRKVYILENGKDHYAIFDEINYCHCDEFTRQVLTNKASTCQHVLAVKLAKITQTIKEELLTESQFIELLSNQFTSLASD